MIKLEIDTGYWSLLPSISIDLRYKIYIDLEWMCFCLSIKIREFN